MDGTEWANFGRNELELGSESFVGAPGGVPPNPECSGRNGTKLTTLLGLPSRTGCASKSLWNPVVEIIEQKLSSWKARFL